MTTSSTGNESNVRENQELAALGMAFPRWQDAVEAAIGTQRLAVTGEVRGGQLIQYSDPSGAQLNILAVEPYATFVGFAAQTSAFGHVTMLNNVLALIDIVDPYGETVTSATANLAQGPLLVDEDTQQWQQVGLTALGLEVAEADPNTAESEPDLFRSAGAEIVAAGSGAQTPTPAVEFSGRVMEAEWQDNALTGQRFMHVMVDGKVPFDLCLPESFGALPAQDTVLTGRALLTASIVAPGAGCGSGGGGCGCGSCGCGGH